MSDHAFDPHDSVRGTASLFAEPIEILDEATGDLLIFPDAESADAYSLAVTADEIEAALLPGAGDLDGWTFR